jgi:signal transduction histidine kinase
VGLAVVKQVVEAHGFHIRVGDSAGVGAEFVVRFPPHALEQDAGHASRAISSEAASTG